MNKAITCIKNQIEMGVIELRQDGTFWKKARLTHTGMMIPIEPKRMEVRLKNGYLGVVVWSKGKQYLSTAHKAVWMLMIGDIPEHMDINHKDGNKHNNNPNNLEVVTRGENLLHAYRTGLKKKTNYAKDYSLKAKELRVKGLSFSQIARELGISQTTAFRASNY